MHINMGDLSHTLTLVSVWIETLDTTVIVLSCCSTLFGRADWFFRFHTSESTSCLQLPCLSQTLCIKNTPSAILPVRLKEKTFGGCLHILPAFVELGVMNGASDVPPICVHPAQQESIITLFLAGRTHSQFVPDIILQAEHTLFCHIVSWLSDNGAFVRIRYWNIKVFHYFCV